jgi:hypothetical protein
LASLEKERESIENQAGREGPALEVQDKAAKIRVLLDRLRGLETAALDGSRLLSAEVRAQREMTEIRDVTIEERELRASLAEHAQFLNVSEPPLTENIDAILDRLEATLSQKEGSLKVRLAARRVAIENFDKTEKQTSVANGLRREIQRLERDEIRVSNAYSAASVSASAFDRC